MIITIALISLSFAQPFRGLPEEPVPHPPVIELQQHLPTGQYEPYPKTEGKIHKIELDIKPDLLPTAGELQISTAMLACRNLDTQYESVLAGERQLYARIINFGKQEKTATPEQLIDIRKRVDDLNLSMLKLKKERVKLSEEMGDILKLLTVREQNQIIEELKLKEKVELYKNVMVILNEEKKQKAKEDKVIFEMKVRDGIEAAHEKTKIEKEVAFGHKKKFYVKTVEAETILDKINQFFSLWDQQIQDVKSRDMCKFQFTEILNQTATKTFEEIRRLRKLLKEAREERKLVHQTIKNGLTKTLDALKQLKKENTDPKKQAIIQPEIDKVYKEIDSIKEKCELKPIEKKLSKRESDVSEMYQRKVVIGRRISRTIKTHCRNEPIWKVGPKRALKLFNELDVLEGKFKKIK